MTSIHIVADKSEGGVFGLDVRASIENLKFPPEWLNPDSVEDVTDMFVKVLHLKGVHDARNAKLLLTKDALHVRLMFNHGTTVHVDVLPIVEKAMKSAAVTMRLPTDKAEVFKAQFEVLAAASLARGRLSAKSSGGGGARGKSRDKSEDSDGEERNSLAEKIDALLAGGAKDKEVASLLEKALSGRKESVSSTASTDMRMAMLLSPALSKPFSTQKMVSKEEALNGESRKVLREIKEANKIITSMAEQFIEQSSAYCPAMREVQSRYNKQQSNGAAAADANNSDE